METTEEMRNELESMGKTFGDYFAAFPIITTDVIYNMTDLEIVKKRMQGI